MSAERRTEYVWTCDACGHSVTVSSDQERPVGGWRQIVVGSLTAKLGNLPARHLCGDCASQFDLLMEGQLADAGDMRQAVYDALARVRTNDGRDVTATNLRWAATHESLCRTFIFDVLSALADYLDGGDS